MTPVELLAVTIVMSCGAVLQGSVGHGMALLVSPILLLIDPGYIPGPLISAAFFLTILVLLREKKAIDFTGLKWATIGMILGVVIATILISVISHELVSVLFGVSILLAVLMSLSGVKLNPTPLAVLIASVISGFMSIITTTSGPPLALVYQKSEGAQLRSVLGGVFIIGAIISVISLSLIGRFGLNEFVQSLALYPGILIGFLFSNKVLPYIDRGFIRPLVLTISAVSGVVILAGQIF